MDTTTSPSPFLSAIPTSFSISTTTTPSAEVTVGVDQNPRLPNGVMVAVVMMAGLLGNAFVLHVYGWRMRSSVFCSFVTALAWLDLATIVLAMPLDVTLKTMLLRDTPAFNGVCKVAHFVVYTTSLSSGGVLLLIAVTRYNKVCRPMQAGLSLRAARLLIGLIVLLGLALSTLTFLINGLEKVKLTVGQSSASVTAVPRPTVELRDREGRNTTTTTATSASTAAMDLPAPFASSFGSEEVKTATSSVGLSISPSSNGWGRPSSGYSHHSDDEGTTSVTKSLISSFFTQSSKDNPSDKSEPGAVVSPSTSTVREVVQVLICRTNEERSGTAVQLALQIVLMSAFFALFLSLLGLHCRISRSVRHFQRRQSTLRRASVLSDSDQSSVTHVTGRMYGMFTCITVMLVVSYVPHLVCLALERGLYSGGRPMSPGLRVALDMLYNLPYLNVLTNPAIYSCRSPQFRRHCADLMGSMGRAVCVCFWSGLSGCLRLAGRG